MRLCDGLMTSPDFIPASSLMTGGIGSSTACWQKMDGTGNTKAHICSPSPLMGLQMILLLH